MVIARCAVDRRDGWQRQMCFHPHVVCVCVCVAMLSKMALQAKRSIDWRWNLPEC